MEIHIESLPVEILEKIFSYLPAKSLWSCLGVSKQWRGIVNSDRIWKKHSNYVGIYENDNLSVSDKMPLCYWATAYLLLHIRPLLNCRTGNWRESELELKSPENHGLWFNRLGYVYYYSLGLVCIYKLTQRGVFELTEEINVEILNQGGSEQVDSDRLATNIDFIAVGNCNIVIIFQRTDERYKPTHCICLSRTGGILCSTDMEKLDHFIISNYWPEVVLRGRYFLGNTVWLFSPNCLKFFVFDLVTNSVKFRLNMVLICTQLKIPFLVSLDCDMVEVYDSNCKVVLSLNDLSVGRVYFNHHILVLKRISSKSRDNSVDYLQSWDLATGKELMNLLQTKVDDVILHEFYNYMIVLKNDKEIKKVTCYCPRTARMIWKLDILNEHYLSPQMQIMMHEFVVVWSKYNHDYKCSLYNIENGKLLLKKTGLAAMPYIGGHRGLKKNKVFYQSFYFYD